MSATYVEHGGLATAPGPLECSGTTMFGFWAQAEQQSLLRLCERVFDQPSGGRVVVRPWMRWVLISFVRIDRIVSQPEAFKRVGHLSEREVVIWIPSVVFRPLRWAQRLPGPIRRRLLAPSYPLSAVIPCMWLDNPISIASGREVYGYPKSWGCMESDPAEAIGEQAEPSPPGGLPPAPASLSLEAFGVREYGRDESPSCRPLLKLRRDGAVANVERHEHLDELLRQSAARLEVDSQAAAAGAAVQERSLVRDALIDAVLGRIEVSQIFLKQFRSAAGDGLACSQEIVRAPATEIRGFRWDWLPRYRLEVSHLDSHPLDQRQGGEEADLLGLGLGSQRIDTAFVARFDFRVERGEVLWRAR